MHGKTENLREEDLEKESIKEKLTALFSGVQRSSGTEEFLEELFLNGSYEAVVTYEASIININKKLEAAGKEPLYVIYTRDGVSISDAPFAYIDNKDKTKQKTFEILQSYLRSSDGQEKLGQTGRRVWYGGINENADKRRDGRLNRGHDRCLGGGYTFQPLRIHKIRQNRDENAQPTAEKQRLYRACADS